ncbi:hypothetical protein C8R47DRAFT_725018 [Mycena vitilis]|nr:hypothetical protein C8R47DRAFT_725018 [Mycena vitilis]
MAESRPRYPSPKGIFVYLVQLLRFRFPLFPPRHGGIPNIPRQNHRRACPHQPHCVAASHSDTDNEARSLAHDEHERDDKRVFSGRYARGSARTSPGAAPVKDRCSLMGRDDLSSNGDKREKGSENGGGTTSADITARRSGTGKEERVPAFMDSTGYRVAGRKTSEARGSGGRTWTLAMSVPALWQVSSLIPIQAQVVHI